MKKIYRALQKERISFFGIRNDERINALHGEWSSHMIKAAVKVYVDLILCICAQRQLVQEQSDAENEVEQFDLTRRVVFRILILTLSASNEKKLLSKATVIAASKVNLLNRAKRDNAHTQREDEEIFNFARYTRGALIFHRVTS